MLPELDELERLVAAAGRHVQCEAVSRIEDRGTVLPIYAVTLGNPDPACAAVGYFGGIHGIERIGAQVVVAFLGNLVARLAWDDSLHAALEHVRIVFMPLVNPAGALRGRRGNTSGVDLMRNAPVESAERVLPLIGGHRIASWLPWYRGRAGAAMEPESAAVCSVVQRELVSRPFSVALDCHSGFGMRDRLWFPYAHRRSPIEALPELDALHQVFVRTHPHHTYVIEPQSAQYLAHGDLWDHLCLQASGCGGVFLALTLEMGSWIWVKKNPRQVFARGGIFNPLIGHREDRTLRRHLPLLDFLLRAAASHQRWRPGERERDAYRTRGLARWYRRSGP